MKRTSTSTGAYAGPLVMLGLIVALLGCGPGGAAPTVGPTVPATVAPAPTTLASTAPTAAAATVSPTKPVGQPLPDTLIGAWAHVSGAFMWLIRAGDPACTALAHTDLDCAVWQPAGKPSEVAAASLVNGALALAWVSGYCTRVTSTYRMAITGDAVTLTELPGGCGGGNFALTRAGTGTAATAPPKPTP